MAKTKNDADGSHGKVAEETASERPNALLRKAMLTERSTNVMELGMGKIACTPTSTTKRKTAISSQKRHHHAQSQHRTQKRARLPLGRHRLTRGEALCSKKEEQNAQRRRRKGLTEVAEAHMTPGGRKSPANQRGCVRPEKGKQRGKGRDELAGGRKALAEDKLGLHPPE